MPLSFNRRTTSHDARPTFQLHRGCAAFLNQSARVAHRFLDGYLVGQKRKVGDDQRSFDATADRARMMNHHVERHWQRRVVTQHNHAHRITDKNHIEAGPIEKPGHAGVIGCKNGDLCSLCFHGPQVGHADWFHKG